ncbi:MAG: hypothetical protein R2712_30715 [Vicinamibacterales bacterium]
MVLPRHLLALRFAFVLTASLLAAQASAQDRIWTAPEMVSPAGQSASMPATAIDGSGNVVVTWTAEQGGLRQAQAARLNASGAWLPATNLYTPPSSGSAPLDTTAVALTSAGRGAAAWVRSIGTGPATLVVQAAIYTGTAWRAPVTLTPTPASSVGSPQVGVDTNGNVIAAWVQILSGISVVRTSRYDRDTNTWSAPASISAATESVDGGVVVTADDGGNAVAVWTGTSGGVRSLRTARYDAQAAAWSLAASIAPAGRSPSIVKLATNGAGTLAVLAYRGFDGARDVLRAARLNPSTGTWSAPEDLSAPGVTVVELDVAVDDDGRALAVWNEADGSVKSSRYTTAWSSPGERSPAAPTRDVSVTVDGAAAPWPSGRGSTERGTACRHPSTRRRPIPRHRPSTCRPRARTRCRPWLASIPMARRCWSGRPTARRRRWRPADSSLPRCRSFVPPSSADGRSRCRGRRAPAPRRAATPSWQAGPPAARPSSSSRWGNRLPPA